MQYSLAPSYTFGLDRPRALSALGGTQGSGLTLGLLAKYSTTNLDHDNVVSRTRPYGSDDFGQLGAFAAFEWDKRDHPIFPRRGARLRMGGAVYPKAWDVRDPFGEIHGEADAYLGASSLPLEPTLAFRAGGKRVFGTYPFQEAAFLGGRSSLRGFRQNRFAGDGSLYGSAELRLALFKLEGAFPQDWGVFGFGDAGRVYLESEPSDQWHKSAGGGLWVSLLSPAFTLSVSYSRSDEKTTSVDFHVGFAF
jgi:outer membrane protein assembly factor BamA